MDKSKKSIASLSALIKQGKGKLVAITDDHLSLEFTNSVHLHDCFKSLINHDSAPFTMLMDIACVDYLHYKLDQWQSQKATSSGFSRAVDTWDIEERAQRVLPEGIKSRFKLVYQLLCMEQKIRITANLWVDDPKKGVLSVVDLWPSANWFEREAFDLFGVYFQNHPFLKRILTDYDFKGHPFCKDFPLVGEVEMRYDGTKADCIYEEVSIENRLSVPKVIREGDNRYTPIEDVEGRDGR